MMKLGSGERQIMTPLTAVAISWYLLRAYRYQPCAKCVCSLIFTTTLWGDGGTSNIPIYR